MKMFMMDTIIYFYGVLILINTFDILSKFHFNFYRQGLIDIIVITSKAWHTPKELGANNSATTQFDQSQRCISVLDQL